MTASGVAGAAFAVLLIMMRARHRRAQTVYIWTLRTAAAALFFAGAMTTVGMYLLVSDRTDPYATAEALLLTCWFLFIFIAPAVVLFAWSMRSFPTAGTAAGRTVGWLGIYAWLLGCGITLYDTVRWIHGRRPFWMQNFDRNVAGWKGLQFEVENLAHFVESPLIQVIGWVGLIAGILVLRRSPWASRWLTLLGSGWLVLALLRIMRIAASAAAGQTFPTEPLRRWIGISEELVSTWLHITLALTALWLARRLAVGFPSDGPTLTMTRSHADS